MDTKRSGGFVYRRAPHSVERIEKAEVECILLPGQIPARQKSLLKDSWLLELVLATLSLTFFSAAVGVITSASRESLSICVQAAGFLASGSAATIALTVISCIFQLAFSSSKVELQNGADAKRVRDKHHTGLLMRLAYPMFLAGTALLLVTWNMGPSVRSAIGVQHSGGDVLATESGWIPYADGYDTPREWKDILDSRIDEISHGSKYLQNTMEAHCPSGNCAFPGFKSLGLCSRCADVTTSTSRACSMDDTTGYTSCYFRRDGGLENEVTSQPNSDCRGCSTGQTHALYIANTGIPSYKHSDIAFAGVQHAIAGFSGIKLIREPGDDIGSPLELRSDFKYEATECAMYLCEKTYRGITVKNGKTLGKPALNDTGQLYVHALSTYLGRAAIDLSFDESDGDQAAWDAASEHRAFAIKDYHEAGKVAPYNLPQNEDLRLSDALSGVFDVSQFGDVNKQKLAKSMYLNDVSDVAETVATTITDKIRSGPGSKRMQAVRQPKRTVRVQYRHLILPAIAVIGGIAFLGMTIYHTAQLRVPHWKSTVL